MIKRLSVLTILLVLLLSCFSLALETKIAEPENDCVYYFYGQGCDNCEALDNFLSQLQDKYPGITIKKTEVYYNKANQDILNQYFAAYNVPKTAQGLPAAFISNSYYIGDQEIQSMLETRIKNNKDNTCPSLTQFSTIGVLGAEKSSTTILSGLTIPVITSSAFQNALAPGALALTILLLIILVTFKVRREMFKRGMLFILGIFLAYFLFGMGIFSWFAYSSIRLYFYRIVAVLGIIFAVWMIKRYWDAKERDYQPEHLPHHYFSKKTFDQILTEIFAPQLVVIFGFLLGLCSFAKVHENLLFIRYIFLEGSANWTAIGLLVYYVFIFLLPAIVLVLLFSYTRGALEEHANKRGLPAFHLVEWWKRHNLELLNLVISIIVLLVGMYLILA